MSSQNVWSVFWPDLFHRCARRTAQALNSGGGTVLLKSLNKLFKFTRAPFSSAKFGRTMQSHREHLVAALRKGQATETREMWMSAVARDAGADEATFGVKDLIALFEKKSGAHMHSSQHNDSRWFSFHDHCISWDAQWHLQAMVHSFSWWAEGVDPWGMKVAEEGSDPTSYSLRVAAWHVLADDTNQGSRWGINLDRDLQRNPGASLKHAVSLATGKRVERLWSKTLADCNNMSALEYVGALSNDPEAVENLQFHCSMLVSQLAALSDIDLYHQSFPWRVVAAMDPASIKQVLQSMKLQWEFCVNFVDALICTDKLHTWFSFTRHQSFRDVMVKAELLW